MIVRLRRTSADVSQDNLEQSSDGALAIAISRWRQGALAEAYRRHGGAIFALARRVLGSHNLAEEVVQEVFVRLWYETERFDPERGSLRSYLLAQTHGRAVDLLRSETARRQREQNQALQVPSEPYHLESEVEALTVAEHVRDALQSLPEPERRAIEMAYFGGRTYREVAKFLGEPEGTVKSRIRAGLRRVRAALVDAGVAST